MKKYHTMTKIFDIESEESFEKVVEDMINSIQKEHFDATLHSVKQSLLAGGLVADDRAMITVVMETSVSI